MESVKNRDRKKTAKALLAMRRPLDEPPPTQTRCPPHNTTLLARTALTRTPLMLLDAEGWMNVTTPPPLLASHMARTMTWTFVRIPYILRCDVFPAPGP